jgi:ribosomal-protein-alanine N-acetyltransferase
VTAPEIRVATTADVDAVLDLEQEVFGVDAWSRDSVVEELTGERRHAVVAVEDGVDDGLVGYAVTMRAGDLVDLQRIAVAASHRRRGLARRLLDSVRQPLMLLEVSATNEVALAFYDAQGFEVIDRRPHYYRDGTDAVVMRLGTACQNDHHA